MLSSLNRRKALHEMQYPLIMTRFPFKSSNLLNVQRQVCKFGYSAQQQNDHNGGQAQPSRLDALME
jgi:hypothetical protein